MKIQLKIVVNNFKLLHLKSSKPTGLLLLYEMLYWPLWKNGLNAEVFTSSQTVEDQSNWQISLDEVNNFSWKHTSADWLEPGHVTHTSDDML